MNQSLYIIYSSLPFPVFEENAVDEETYFEFMHLEADIAGWYSRGDLSKEVARFFVEKLISIEGKIASKLDSEFRTSVQMLLDAVSSE